MSTNLTAGLPPVLDEVNPSITLGAEYTAPDGIRKYRYVKAGALALVTGSLYQGPAEDTADQAIAFAAASVGATQIVSTTTMTVTANQYAGGYVVVTTAPDLGGFYRIKSHAAYTAAAATFELESPLQVAWTTATRADFVANPYNGVVVAPTTLTSSIVGFAVNDITAGQYGWVQVAGPGAVLNDAAGALVVGDALMASSSVGGAVRVQLAGKRIVAQALAGIATSVVGAADITIS